MGKAGIGEGMGEIMEVKDMIVNGSTALGIEFGSTRIKAVLIDKNKEPIASGSFQWENSLVDGVWTYSLEDVWKGLQECYYNLKKDVEEKYNVRLIRVGSIGISAMMHGYMAFDDKGKLLVPFRTWRNTMTKEAAGILTKEFDFNVPQRWSIAHLYQAILNKEEHVADIDFITTLAGYVHWKLTGEKVLGIGDASGMFPVDSTSCDYDKKMLTSFANLTSKCGYSWTLPQILPKILIAGDNGGTLTKDGALLLDPAGELASGILVCPPEGDAGTGMTATNSIAVGTGNVSAGTSVFAMIVMEHKMKSVHEEIDVVTTPEGAPVAMVHCNNCTSDLNGWIGLFEEFANGMGMKISRNDIYTMLFNKALLGKKDCRGMVSYNYDAGEPVTGFEKGCPVFVRQPGVVINLADFMRTQLYGCVATLRAGLEIIFEEDIKVKKMYGHGGFFKTESVGQQIMAAAMNTPVTVMETAGEGGAWGIAILAMYMQEKASYKNLGDYLENSVFAGNVGKEVVPDIEDVKGFNEYMKSYKAGLDVVKAAVLSM